MASKIVANGVRKVLNLVRKKEKSRKIEFFTAVGVFFTEIRRLNTVRLAN